MNFKSLFLLSLLAYLLFPNHSLAQLEFGLPTEITRAPGQIRGIGCGDLDNNGFSDVVYAAGDGRIVMIFQNESSQFLSHTVLARSVFNPIDLEVWDIDEDGDLDISLAKSDNYGRIFNYMNNGNGIFGDPSILETSLSIIDGFMIFDLDNNGHQDIIVNSSSDLSMHWAKNNGLGTIEPFTPLIVGYNFKDNWSFGDTDNDGDNDMIADRFTSPSTNDLVHVEQTGNLIFTAPVTIDPLNELAPATVLLDLENDGDLDVCASYGSNNFIQQYVNDGSGSFSIGDVISNAGYTTKMFAYDWNADNLVELISVQSSDDQIVVHNNNGTSLSTGGSIINEDSPRFVRMMDMDTDGDIDFVYGTYTAGVNNLHISRNTGNNYFSPSVVLTDKAEKCGAIFCDDLNADGLNDLIYSDGEDDFFYAVVANSDHTFQPHQTLASYTNAGIWGENKADFDQDGDQDLVFERFYSTDNQYLTLLKKNGTNVSFSGSNYFSDHYIQDVKTGDFNGDNFPDLLIVNDFYYVSWVANENSGQFNSIQSISNVGSSNHKTCIINANNDQYSDVVCQNSAGGVVVKTFNNLGAIGSTTEVIAVANGIEEMLAADINMDGFEDLIVSADVDAWYENDGNGGFAVQHILSPGFTNLNQMVVADLNNDSYPELIAKAITNYPERSILIFTNDGNGELGSPQTIHSNNQDFFALATGDIDMDGFPDVITSDETQGSLIWLRNLTAVCTSSNGQISDDVQVCLGESATLTAGGGLSYAWGSEYFGPQIEVSPIADTMYTVTIVSDLGCVETLSTNVQVLSLPNFVATIQGSNLHVTGGIAYQWYFNGDPILGATQATYTPTDNGTYYATGISNQTCEGVSNNLEVTFIAVLEHSFDQKLVFPNPGRDRFSLSMDNSGIREVKVLDITGKNLCEFKASNNQREYVLPFTLSSGQYLIRIHMNDGSMVLRKWCVE